MRTIEVLTEIEAERRCDLSGRRWTRSSPVRDVMVVMVVVWLWRWRRRRKRGDDDGPTCTETPEIPSRTAQKETTQVGRNGRGIKWHLVECLGRTV